MEGISNDEIVKFFEKNTDVDLKKNFVGVFPSNYVIKFISFHEMMQSISLNRFFFLKMYLINFFLKWRVFLTMKL